MSNKKTNPELISAAIESVSAYLDKLSNSENKDDKSKANLLSYWLKDYIKFIEFEKDFNPQRLIRYKRGDIIKVHLGFNVGSEEGGLHYAVVVEADNPMSSPVITVVPLTSIKPDKDLSHLRRGEVNCGDRLFNALSDKIFTLQNDISKQLKETMEILKKIEKTSYTGENAGVEKLFEQNQTEINEIRKKIQTYEKKIKNLEKIGREIFKMKVGSIALVNQITTISKMRIYDPKKQFDVLNGIRMSDKELDAIDEEIQKLFMKKNSKNPLTN